MQNTLPITGYLDRLSCRPNETLAARISLRTPGPYEVTLHRLISADPNPQGPGQRTEDLGHLYRHQAQGRTQPVDPGSYALIAAGPACDPDAPRTWTALVRPGVVRGEQAVIDDTGITLGLGPSGAFARLPDGTVLATGTPMKPKRWYRVFLGADPATGRLVIGQVERDRGTRATATTTIAGTLPSGGAIRIAADATGLRFTGKIEAPAILQGFPETGIPAGPVLAQWDFAQGIGSTRVIDIGPSACHGELINLPTRAVVGADWTGAEHCWRHAPQDYAAIHFHADDLNDCGWDTDFTFAPPAGLRSGCYLLHLTCAEGQDWLPFYLLPDRQGPRAAIVFLASTFTYIAYANHARGNTDAAFRERVAAWGAYPHNPDDYPVYGASTYNRHPDNSGIALSSRLRPILTMRPGYITFNDAKGSGLRHFPADSHILAWLEDQGLAYDVLTDEDLDDEGLAALIPYRVLLTGSHPEYHTPRMLDALQAYTDQGGRMCYLGGNGFYWRIARDKALPHTIEVRRAEGGIRAWEAEPGEYYHQLDGGMGGLWRRSRRPPQRLVGVGFSGQGFFEGTHYRRLPASYAAEHAWMFDGIDTDIIGDYGLSGGGAAGFEFDRADPRLGTPDGTVILARSENPPDHVVTVPEELLSHLATTNGEPPDALRRAEIVYFRTAGGGEVFSVGSITFCGSLWQNGWQGPVSRLLGNVVRRFAGVLVVAAMLLPAIGRTEPLRTEAQLPLAVALDGAKAALDGCLAQDYRIAVTVVDREGQVLVTLRADGARPHLLEGALRKAYTAAMLRISTVTMGGIIQKSPGAAGLMAFQNMTALGGGLPVKIGDDVVAGIGVAGVPVGGAGGAGDEGCARLGLDRILARIGAAD